MSSFNFQQAEFLISAAAMKQFPPDQGAEVAFAGRSNAGKSSAINSITKTHNLARTSKTPGRTQLINFFTLTEKLRLVDLPGYGYADVPDRVRQGWEELLGEYFEVREALKGVVLVTDIRHALNPFDHQMLNFCQHHLLPVHILLTKADKLSRGAATSILKRLEKELSTDDSITLQLFSAHSGTGVDEARSWLTHALNS